MVALSDAVIVPSPVSVFPEKRPMSAEPTAPPTSACAGATASIADTPIVIEIPFIQPLRTGETILKSYYPGSAPKGRRGSTPVVARVRQ